MIVVWCSFLLLSTLTSTVFLTDVIKAEPVSMQEIAQTTHNSNRQYTRYVHDFLSHTATALDGTLVDDDPTRNRRVADRMYYNCLSLYRIAPSKTMNFHFPLSFCACLSACMVSWDLEV